VQQRGYPQNPLIVIAVCRDGLAGELVQHMVAVNQITTLPTAAEQMVFVQEVYCRAYALHVLVSSITGWSVTYAPDGTPGGKPLKHGHAEGAVELLDMLYPTEPKAKRAKGVPLLHPASVCPSYYDS
jgi:hypothetical protein